MLNVNRGTLRVYESFNNVTGHTTNSIEINPISINAVTSVTSVKYNEKVKNE